MRNAELGTDAGNHLRFSAAAGAKRVIHRRSLDLARPCRRGEQQQREAIGTAGHGDPDARSGRGQRVEIAPKAVDQGRIELRNVRHRDRGLKLVEAK